MPDSGQQLVPSWTKNRFSRRRIAGWHAAAYGLQPKHQVAIARPHAPQALWGRTSLKFDLLHHYYPVKSKKCPQNLVSLVDGDEKPDSARSISSLRKRGGCELHWPAGAKSPVAYGITASKRDSPWHHGLQARQPHGITAPSSVAPMALRPPSPAAPWRQPHGIATFTYGNRPTPAHPPR